MTKQFTKGAFPEGEILEHPLDLNRHRITSAELRAKERLFESDYDETPIEYHRKDNVFNNILYDPDILNNILLFFLSGL